MLVAILIVSLVASVCSIPVEEVVKEQAPQKEVKDLVDANIAPKTSVPYFPPSVSLPNPDTLALPQPGGGDLPPLSQPAVGSLPQPEEPQQLDAVDPSGSPVVPAVEEGVNQPSEESDLKTDATIWGYGGYYRRPYYGWGGYYSNPYRRWGGYGYPSRYYGYGRGYGGGWGSGYRGGWGGYW